MKFALYKSLLKEMTCLLLFLAVGLIYGFQSGSFLVSLLVALFCYTIFSIFQKLILFNWINSSSESPSPKFFGVCQSISSSVSHVKKREGKTLSRYKSLLQRIQTSAMDFKDAVIMLDGGDAIVWWNATAENMFGLEESRKGIKITDFLAVPEFGKYFDESNFDDVLEFTYDQKKHFMLLGQVIRFGSNDQLLVLRDVTQLHDIETMRKDFVANVSHELRTPLTVMLGYLETYIDNSDQVPSNVLNGLQQMQQQAVRMESLVTDLLLLSSLETSAKEQEYEFVDVSKMLKSIKHDAEIFSLDKNHVISCDCDDKFKLVGSERELHSAFANLVFNAAKYTEANGEIKMRVWLDDNAAYFSVTDNGIGIDSKHIKRLAERFYRVDKSRSMATGGTGLGLAIVKHVLLRHQAEIMIKSELGKGSTFTCRFPLSRISAM